MAVSRGDNVFGRITPNVLRSARESAGMNDLFLYALFARLALNNEENVEFRTIYDPLTNTIELDIPNSALPFLDQIYGIQRGEKFKAYINWLIGSDTLEPTPIMFDQDPNFVAVGAMSVWAGATQGNLDDKRLILYLPSNELSVIGYNTKIDGSIIYTRMKIYLIWAYDSGDNTSYDLRTSVVATEITTGNSSEITNDTNISTFNLLRGDIRETEIMDTGEFIHANDIVSIKISRNWDGSPDPQTELPAIVGLRLDLIDV